TAIVQFWRFEINIVNLSADRTTAATGYSRFQNPEGDVNKDRVQSFVSRGRQILEHLRLRNGAGKTVEHVTVLEIWLARSFPHDAAYKIVGCQLTCGLHFLDFLCQLIVLLRSRAQDVARGNLRQMQPLLQQARLRALAGTRRAHQNDDLGHGLVISSFRSHMLDLKLVKLAVRATFHRYRGTLRNYASPIALRSGTRYPLPRPPE